MSKNQVVVNKTDEQIIASGDFNQIAAAPAVEVLSAEAGMGLDDGKQIQTAIDQADVQIGNLARNILIERAKQFGGNDAKKREYFSGFRKAFSNPKTADSRVSEIKAVMDAYDKDAEKVLAITGGGYVALVENCRNIRGKSARGRKANTVKVSDKGMLAIESKVPVMTAGQAKVLADMVNTQLVAASPDNWEKAVLIQIEDLSDRLSKSTQPIFAELGSFISESCGEVLDKLNIAEAEQKAKEAKTVVQESENSKKDAAPQPAEYSDKEAEKALADYSDNEQNDEQQHAA